MSGSIKLGRNALCPCDSGKKYKKCCLINPGYEDNEEKHEHHAVGLLGRKRLLHKLNNENMTFAPAVDSMPKISAAILELAKDMLDCAKNKSERKTAITTACIAWNMAVLTEDDQSLHGELNHFLTKCVDDKQCQEDLKQLVSSMVIYKKLLFPDDMRLVVDFEIVDTKSYFSVNVASMLPT